MNKSKIRDIFLGYLDIFRLARNYMKLRAHVFLNVEEYPFANLNSILPPGLDWRSTIDGTITKDSVREYRVKATRAGDNNSVARRATGCFSTLA